MKQLILGTTIGVAAGLLLGSTAVYAATQVIELPWTKNIYTVSDNANRTSAVSVFDDQENKCYVVQATSEKIDTPVAISCVKRGDR